MRRRSGTLDEGRSGFNGGGCAGGRCAGARAGTDARGVPQGVLRGRAGGAGAPAVGRRAGVRAGGRAQPMARRESTTPQHVGARGVPQGGGLAARLRLRKDEEEDALPQEEEKAPEEAQERASSQVVLLSRGQVSRTDNTHTQDRPYKTVCTQCFLTTSLQHWTILHLVTIGGDGSGQCFPIECSLQMEDLAKKGELLREKSTQQHLCGRSASEQR